MFINGFIKKNLLASKVGVGSIALALALPAVILSSLPGIVIDGFIFFNFISAALLLIITLENDEPLKVTFLPTVVLLLTTFRLLLSIATTRNIISNEDVGQVITTIGQFIMGNNLTAGLLIFIIITIVQFLVVTKGGERVAEVGARFSLDALPGRQMTIDGDLKSGLLTGEQAQILRNELSTENKLFGSLDGAMKFIKGDAIAGILISLVNLFGGLYVGVNQFQLTLSESLTRFATLTIGDGLVSQIPSLLLSMACGVYLTRIKGAQEDSSSFIAQVVSQVKSFWKALIIIGTIILSIGFYNPELLLLCIFLSSICIVVAVFLRFKDVSKDKIVQSTLAGSGVYANLKFISKHDVAKEKIDMLVKHLSKKLWGQAIGEPIVILDHKSTNDLSVYISDVLIFAFDRQNITDGYINIADEGMMPLNENIEDNIEDISSFFLYSLLTDKYNLQITNNIVESLGGISEVMKNEVDSSIGINRAHEVVKEMLNSPEFYLDQVSFFEEMLYWSRNESEPKYWFARMRNKAKYDITAFLTRKTNKLHFLLINPQLMIFISDFAQGAINDVDELISIQDLFKNKIIEIIKKDQVLPIIMVEYSEIGNVQAFIAKFAKNIIVCGNDDISMLNIESTSEVIGSSYG